MRTNKAGIDLIKKAEGLRLQAYVCAAGKNTIGWGHTKTTKPGMSITKEEAERLLVRDVEECERAIERLVKVPLSDNQFSALVSFVFNLGAGALEGSTLLKLLNAGVYDAVPSQLMRWVNAAGKQLPGLVKRRKAEGDLWKAA